MKSCFFAIALILASTNHLPKNDAPKTDAQRTMDRNMDNAKTVHDAQAKAADRAQMQDRGRDGGLKVSEHTSVGGNVERNGKSVTGASVNVKTDLDTPKK